jgi:hypothetical protein
MIKPPGNEEKRYFNRDPPAKPAHWRGGGAPPDSVAGPATLQQNPHIGGAEALRPIQSRGPRPSSKARTLEGRRRSARFGRRTRDPSKARTLEGRRRSARFSRGARDPPAKPAHWRDGGAPPNSVAGPATLQQNPHIGGAEALRPIQSRGPRPQQNPHTGGAEALRPIQSRGPRPSSKTRALEGRRRSARFSRGTRDPPAKPA